MVEQAPAKRQRTAYSARKPQSLALSAKQKEAIRAAQQLEQDVAIDEQLHRLGTGKAQKGEIAWSRHNLIACASASSLCSPNTEAHVVLRYAGAKGPTPSRLYPPRIQPHSSAPALPNLVGDVHSYDDPTSIAFSPCGFYLSAFFPLRDRPSSPRPSRSNTTEQATLAKDLFQAVGPAEGAPMIGHLGAVSAKDDESGPRTDLANGRLCIWSRAGTGALNDWSITYSVPVSEESGRKSGRLIKAENVLKVDEHGRQVAEDASQSPQAKTILRGGVLQTLWLNQRRRTVLSEPAASSKEFARLAARGPAFLPSTSEVEPDADLALLVFGRQGQVNLLYSRHCDRGTEGTSPSVGSTAFSVLQSALHVPCVHPAPATFDSETFDDDTQAPNAVAYSSSSATDDGDVSHLTVGMLANTSALLVASKRMPYTNAALDLTEISIDLTGEAVSMITRPVLTLSLIATHNDADASNGRLVINGQTESLDLSPQHLTSLNWAEVEEGSARQTATTKLESLRLLATFTYRKQAIHPAILDIEDDRGRLDSVITYWDVYKAEKELSEAFTSLEGRKTGHMPKQLDWQVRPARAVRFRGKAITSVLASVPGLPRKDIGLITTLMPPEEPGEPIIEEMCHLDFNRITIILHPAPSAALPPSAYLRTSSLAVSPNGVLAAVLSSTSSKNAARKVVMWQLPYPTRSDEEIPVSNQDRCSRLVALACLRNTDAVDIAHSLVNISPDEYPKFLLETAGFLRIPASSKAGRTKLEGGGALPADISQVPKVSLGHVLRLLQLRTLIASASDDSSTRIEQFVLELGLCLQVLRLARAQTDQQSADVKPDDKDMTTSTSPPSSSSVGRVYYHPDGVWPILAQLQWLLTLLDRLARLPVLTATDKEDHTFEQQVVTMLNTMSVPRQLTLEILARFCDFKEWLLSTTRKQNLPPARSHNGDITKTEDGANHSWGAYNGMSPGSGVTAISEQMELARDALRHILVSSSVGLDEFTRVLRDLAGKTSDGAEKNSASTWWSELSSRTKASISAAGTSDTLLKSIFDPETGAVLDVLTLFLSPADLLDERSVLFDTSKIASVPAVEHRARDIVRKIPIKNAMSHTAIRNMALSNPPGLESGVVVMRRKECVRCHALSQDAVIVSTTAVVLPQSTEAVAGPAVQYSVHIKPHRVSNPASSLSSFEERFKYVCLCGGGWWASQ